MVDPGRAQGFLSDQRRRILPTVLAQSNDLSTKVRLAVPNDAFLEVMVKSNCVHAA